MKPMEFIIDTFFSRDKCREYNNVKIAPSGNIAPMPYLQSETDLIDKCSCFLFVFKFFFFTMYSTALQQTRIQTYF